jgi:hypothetical protein
MGGGAYALMFALAAAALAATFVLDIAQSARPISPGYKAEAS